MCSFIVLTLLFRVSEKVATPTSVILMTGNTIVGAFWRNLVMTEVSPLTWEYFQVAGMTLGLNRAQFYAIQKGV
jgi:hypothetical protein